MVAGVTVSCSSPLFTLRVYRCVSEDGFQSHYLISPFSISVKKFESRSCVLYIVIEICRLIYAVSTAVNGKC